MSEVGEKLIIKKKRVKHDLQEPVEENITLRVLNSEYNMNFKM